MRKNLNVYFTELKRMSHGNRKIISASILISLFDTLLTVLITILFQIVITRFTDFLNNSIEFNSVLISFIAFAFVFVVQDITNGILNYVLDMQSMQVEKSYRQELFEKVKYISIEEYESENYNNMLTRALENIDGAVAILIFTENSLISGVLYIVLISLYLMQLHPALGLLVLFSAIPYILSYPIKSRSASVAIEDATVYQRQMNYYTETISNRKYVKETRHLGAQGFFMTLWEQSKNKYVDVKMKKVNNDFIVNILLESINLISTLAIAALILFLSLNGQMNAGSIAASVSSVNLINRSLNQFFNSDIANLIQYFPTLKFVNELFSFEEEKVSPIKHVINNLNFENISFSYPNGNLALDNVNFEISGKELVCIVGENGSGKTTLSKLILGLYEPSSGTITLNGQKLDNSEFKALRNNATAVFQNVIEYPLTLEENLLLSQPDLLENKSETSSNKLIELTSRNRLHEMDKSLPDGKNTLLSKEFGGTDLSNGQWQRIAIARGINKTTDLIVFDEPTSAIDPLFEMEILNSIVEDETHALKFIITHRLGICTRADLIIVLDNGHVAETGTHSELMSSQNGIYKNMFEKQSGWYMD